MRFRRSFGAAILGGFLREASDLSETVGATLPGMA